MVDAALRPRAAALRTARKLAAPATASPPKRRNSSNRQGSRAIAGQSTMVGASKDDADAGTVKAANGAKQPW
eukprot:3636059-Alexandrium_andersonii.AAC.1